MSVKRLFVENAANETLDRARMLGYNLVGFEQDHVDYEHLAEMRHKINNENMPYEKKCRWLGYMQGVLVAMCDGFTLDDAKEINKRNQRWP